MPDILLLIADTDRIEDTNYLRLGNELLGRGADVAIGFMDSLAMFDSEIWVDGFQLTTPLVVEGVFPQRNKIRAEDAKVVWTLTLGMRHSFLDKMQLLHCLSERCYLINSLEALMHFKSKYFLASHAEVFQYPKSFASTSPTDLAETIHREGGQWIAKPPAGSLGRDIFLLSKDDPNLMVILESMTGIDSDQYCLIQQYVAEIKQGEKRVLIVNGKPVAQYLRQANRDHRTNVMTGAETSLCELTPKETEYCEEIGQFLRDRGALYVGLDLAYPWVIEFNVVNPGGIQTIESLGGADPSSKIIDEILEFLSEIGIMRPSF